MAEWISLMLAFRQEYRYNDIAHNLTSVSEPDYPKGNPWMPADGYT